MNKFLTLLFLTGLLLLALLLAVNSAIDSAADFAGANAAAESRIIAAQGQARLDAAQAAAVTSAAQGQARLDAAQAGAITAASMYPYLITLLIVAIVLAGATLLLLNKPHHLPPDNPHPTIERQIIFLPHAPRRAIWQFINHQTRRLDDGNQRALPHQPRRNR